MTRRLEGRVALVTGSSSGIGRATAILFAQEGADLVLCDVRPDSRSPEEIPDTQEAVESLGGNVVFEAADVSDENAIRRVFDALTTRFGTTEALSMVRPLCQWADRLGP